VRGMNASMPRRSSARLMSINVSMHCVQCRRRARPERRTAAPSARPSAMPAAGASARVGIATGHPISPFVAPRLEGRVAITIDRARAQRANDQVPPRTSWRRWRPTPSRSSRAWPDSSAPPEDPVPKDRVGTCPTRQLEHRCERRLRSSHDEVRHRWPTGR
jgi:hypothetical protein